MKKRIWLLVLLALVSLSLVVTAFAASGPPVGGCRAPFELHMFMDHEDHEDHHIGLTQDINGDGWICVDHLDTGLHVHMDNMLRLR